MSITAHDDNWEGLRFGLPDRLEKALNWSRVSSGEMAQELGVSRNTISNYINGKTPIKRHILIQWAMKTGVPFSWIETGELPEDPKGHPSDYKGAVSGSAVVVDITERLQERAPAEPQSRTLVNF